MTLKGPSRVAAPQVPLSGAPQRCTMPPVTSKATPFRLNLAGDLLRWRMFVAIGEMGSLTRAALFLDSNPSLLSRQLNALERDCGARLFTRTGRGVELSDLGQRIFPRVKALLADAAQLEDDIVGAAREPAGVVALGVLPSIGNTLVDRLFGVLRQRYPGVMLRVFEGSSGQVEEWLADARIDIAILYRYGSHLPDGEEALAIVDSYLVGRPGGPLTATGEVAFDALHELPFILPGAPNGLRNALDTLARQRHLSLVPVIEADSLPLQKLLVARESLYTVLPLHAVWQEVVDGRLQAARIVDPPLQRTVSMAFSRAKGPARAVSAVAAEIVRSVREMADYGMWRHDAEAVTGAK
ncbi:LysR substrate-binding domain-containing protein [Aquabacterium sp. J223]|uniref:LysR substrate-binding domain-containing protein n=1 Tax=Aquabacterium sp. J223 TaxID=2898431 RepID=UPI0021ADC830|nr:LysR substrate-binding domain-containing protein [Aquabacterium sp. J223]UUX95019.1 LysR substrate-binding domain-containing protein [Aquabacterium sp. J223]